MELKKRKDLGKYWEAHNIKAWMLVERRVRHWKEILTTKTVVHSLKLTYPLKNGGWEPTFLLGRPIFKGYVSFREGIRVPFLLGDVFV